MVSKNIIINKKYLNDISDIQIDDNIIKKIDKFKLKLKTFEDTINYEKINNLDLFNLVKNEKMLLYEPVDYTGWLLFLDCVISNHLTDKNLSILIDSDLYGFIELIKYVGHIDNKFYLTKQSKNLLSNELYKYFTEKLNINIQYEDESKLVRAGGSTLKALLSEENIKYDIIVITDISNVKFYMNYLTDNGMIFLIQSLKFINKDMIELFKEHIKLFSEIEIISPSITKTTGEFITIYKKKDSDVIYPLKIDDFFKYHINRVNKILEFKYHIMMVGNIDIQNKLISTYTHKLKMHIINLMTIFNIPVKTKFTNYYDNKLILINQKLYSQNNVHNYQFINYEINSMKFNFSNDRNYSKYFKLENINKNLMNVRTALYTRNQQQWNHSANELDNFRLLSQYISKKINIENINNNFLHIIEIFRTFNFIDYDKPDLNINYFINDDHMIKNAVNFYFTKYTKTIDIKQNEENESLDIIFIDKIDDFYEALLMLKKNSNIIIKYDIPFSDIRMISLIYMMTLIFKSVNLFKPISSKPYNSEIYIIGRIMDKIEQVNLLKDNIDKNKWFDVPISFTNQLEDYMIEITRLQISYLLNIFYFVDNDGEMDKIKNISSYKTIKDKSNEYWYNKYIL